jgi:hypothetical protein
VDKEVGSYRETLSQTHPSDSNKGLIDLVIIRVKMVK